MKKPLLLLLLLLTLSLPAAAAEPEEERSPGALVAGYMAEHGLNEDNFALGWMDLTTGESWYFGEDHFMVAGSMYKLPLNMVILDRLAAGELDSTDITRGYGVAQAMELSIVCSDNDAAQALRYAISEDNTVYRTALAAYSGYDPAELPEEYYRDNCISPRFLISTLKHLYDNSKDYALLIENMKKAHPENYFRLDNDGLDIAHKYGYFEGYLNDCAIVYTERPFALVVFTRFVPDGERVLSELCALLADFSRHTVATPEPEAAPTPSPAPETDTSPAPEAAPEEARALPLRIPAACLLGLAGLLLLLTWKGRLPALILLLAAAGLLLFSAKPAPAPEETALPIPSAPSSPAPTPTPAPAPTPTPEPAREYTLSFAGDCTIGTLHEWQGESSARNMLYVMGGDWAYPFSGVAQLLAEDDLTMVNLEGTFTDRTAAKGKDYRFRSSPDYARVLTAGGVEVVTLANNHSGDYLEAGLEDTRVALEAQGLLWCDGTHPLIVTLEGGLRLGIMAYNCVEVDLAVGDVAGYMEDLTVLYDACAGADCDFILAYIHWGWEYRTQPESWMRQLAHELADLGCGLVVGSHAHVLQPRELYGQVPIYYSLGNFCYGGHSAPQDMDTVLLRQTLIWENGAASLGPAELIPCSISSTPGLNDFRPVPYEPGSAGWDRVLEKLEIEE